MKIRFEAFQLALNYPFKISDYSRTSTPLVFVRIEEDGIEGIGEASMPPYLGETIETASAFLSKVQFSEFSNMEEMLKIYALYSNPSKEMKDTLNASLNFTQ